jgi:hypothetical protein
LIQVIRDLVLLSMLSGVRFMTHAYRLYVPHKFPDGD